MLAETGAIGRALALCGYGTQFSTELEESNVVDSPVDTIANTTNKSSFDSAIEVLEDTINIDEIRQEYFDLSKKCGIKDPESYILDKTNIEQFDDISAGMLKSINRGLTLKLRAKDKEKK